MINIFSYFFIVHFHILGGGVCLLFFLFFYFYCFVVLFLNLLAVCSIGDFRVFYNSDSMCCPMN